MDTAHSLRHEAESGIFIIHDVAAVDSSPTFRKLVIILTCFIDFTLEFSGNDRDRTRIPLNIKRTCMC
jgi:hypothetical protein